MFILFFEGDSLTTGKHLKLPFDRSDFLYVYFSSSVLILTGRYFWIYLEDKTSCQSC